MHVYMSTFDTYYVYTLKILMCVIYVYTHPTFSSVEFINSESSSLSPPLAETESPQI